jgi:hypothetical protein
VLPLPDPPDCQFATDAAIVVALAIVLIIGRFLEDPQ